MKHTAPEQLTPVVLGKAVIAYLSLCLAGCADVGPGIPSTIEAQVQSSVPAEDGELRLLSSAAWFPTANGFAYHEGSPHARLGLLAITAASVCFLQPDGTSSQFKLVYRSLIGDLSEAKIDSFGLGRRLVLSDSARRIETFELLDSAGTGIDRKTTARAAAILKAG